MHLTCSKALLLGLVLTVLICYDQTVAKETQRDSDNEVDELNDFEDDPEQDVDVLKSDEENIEEVHQDFQSKSPKARRRLYKAPNRRRSRRRRRWGW